MIGSGLQALKDWVFQQVCKGKEMKAQGENALEIVTREPKCFLQSPPRIKNNESAQEADSRAAPCVVIVMRKAGVRGRERNEEDNQISEARRGFLEVQLLFVTYDPGHRTAESQEKSAYEKINDNTEEAVKTVLIWAEETMNKLIRAGSIPGTGWAVEKNTWEYGMLADETGYLADRWPLYYAALSGTFTTESLEQGVQKDDLSSILD